MTNTELNSKNTELNSKMLEILQTLDMQKLSALQKAQNNGISESFSTIDEMPDIPAYGELNSDEEAELRDEIRDYLRRQYAKKASSLENLELRAHICGVMETRLTRTSDKDGEPRPAKKLPIVTITKILTKLASFKMIGANEMESSLYLYNPLEGIYEERPHFIGRLVNTITPEAMQRDRTEVMNRIADALDVSDITKNENLAVLKNGIFDVEKHKLLPFSPKYTFVTKTDAVWDENATEEPAFGENGWTLSKALSTYFDGQRDEITAFFYACQNAILTNRPSKTFVYFYSKAGQTGKGTLTQLLISLVGKRNAGSANIETLESRFGLASVYDKALIYGNENDLPMAKNGSNNLKNLATGDGITVDRKGISAITVSPTPLVVQSMNTEPNFAVYNGGITARARIFVFEHSFVDEGDEDTLVKSKYISSPKLLKWLTHKVLSMDVPDRLPNFKASLAATGEAQSRAFDVYDDWINDRFENFKGTEFPIKLLYLDFNSWRKENNYDMREKISKIKFSKELRNHLGVDWVYEAKHGRANMSDETVKDLMNHANTATNSPLDVDSFKQEFVSDRQATIHKI